MYFLHKIGALGARVLLMFILLLFVYSVPEIVHAETRLNSPYYFFDKTWTKKGSPYILEGDTMVEFDKTLTVEPGVTIIAASTTTLSFKPFINVSGNIKMKGTAEEPIRVIGVPLLLRGRENHFEHVQFEKSWIANSKYSGYRFATTTFISSILSESTTTLAVDGGEVLIKDSEIKGNEVGIKWFGSASSSLTIVNSVLEKNKKFHIQNLRTKSAEAKMNWWGTAEGPGTMNVGPVAATPWLTHDPRVKKIECCSNVLFLPGIQGSRLYRDDTDLLGGGTTTRRAWEPYTSNDVRSLFLTLTGESVNKTIHTKDIIDEAYGIKNIYKSFIAMMNSVVAEKTINEWKPFAYDWRMGIPDVVGEKMLSEIMRLASTSKTGKVTIVAHSNGGLAAKKLGSELEKRGKSTLVDKVLYVAVPALGTPLAVSSLLHGEGQELLGGVVLKSSLAKEWASNMPSAYGLIPSHEFFTRVVDPVITFAGKAIGSYESFSSFLLGKSLSSNLLSKSQELHSTLDYWKFPTTTETVAIAGWGIPTTKTIEYSSSSPRFKKGIEGDGTVVSGSAASVAPTLYFNQGLYNFDQHITSSHADILETEVVKNFISQIISTTTLTIHNMYSSYLSTQKPSIHPGNWLTVSVHSPVDMDIYDSKGRHMGLVPLPGAPADSDLQWFENTIGGQYDLVGDEKYYTIPSDDTYTIKLKGTGIGNFTFQVQKFMGTDMTEVANITYEDLPVTPLLEASTTLTGTTLSPTLSLDVDGNGTSDIKTGSGPMNPLLHLDAIKTIITSLVLDKNEEKHLLHRIEKLRTLITDEKKEVFAKKLKATAEKLEEGHWSLSKLTTANRDLLNSMFDSLLSSLESS